jgi:cysteinyl-tRNA synthetase
VLRLHDTAAGRVREVVLREPGRFSMYVCGPTVYDLPHVGHGRAVLVYDVLRRFLAFSGLEVVHVSNVTDVDDKIIERARLERRSPEDVARRYEQLWWEAVDALGALRPTVAPRASEYVGPMVEAIAELERRGYAYEADDGVYFSVERVADYGLLAEQSLDQLRAGARVEPVAAKRSPMDFALWKRAKPGEPTWASPWGAGRPGWHTECVVMSLDLLGEGFDLHAGGLDLKFPHHENERAQAEALGKRFASHWMHHAFVELEGRKMSKSLGNFTSLADLLGRSDPRALRLLVLQAHYRSPMEVTPRSVAQAEEALARLDALARRLELSPGAGGSEASGAEPALPTVEGLAAAGADEGALARFVRCMEADLDTAGALAVIFELVRDANAAADAGASAQAARAGATALGLAGALGLAVLGGESAVDEEVERLVAERDAARAARDWARADALRAELRRRGLVVEDLPSGTRVRPLGARGRVE